MEKLPEGYLQRKPTIAFLLRRAIAQIIDLILVFITLICSVMIFQFVIPTSLLFVHLLFFLWLGYSVLLETFYDGTIGKLMMGLKIFNISKTRSNVIVALYRNIAKVFIPIFVFDFILILLVDFERRGFHNGFAKCIVVNKDY